MAEEVKRKAGNDVIEIWVSAAGDDELVIAHVPLTQLIATLPASPLIFSTLCYLSYNGIICEGDEQLCFCFVFYFHLKKELWRKVKSVETSC